MFNRTLHLTVYWSSLPRRQKSKININSKKHRVKKYMRQKSKINLNSKKQSKKIHEAKVENKS